MEDRDRILHLVLSRAFLPGNQILDDATFDDLLSKARRVALRGKEVFFHRGDPSDCLAVIVRGRLRAVGPDQSGAEMTRDLPSGELLGEMGVLSGEARSMTVYAVRDSELLTLSKEDMESLMSRHPQLMMGILNTLIGRLRGRTPGSHGTPSCVALAVVPLGPDPLLDGFAEALATSLAASGPTLVLDRSTALARSGETLVDWIEEQEAEHRFLVYVGDLGDSDWTRRCIRQADHVLLVAAATADPSPGPNEEELVWRDHGPTSARRSLVLVHPEGTVRPSGTARWLDSRELHRHFHLRPHRAEDFGRIARTLTERGVGLVLGGGGARGFSQIGVIRALQENGIPIDLIGGTSMGAIVAAAYAMGWDAPTMTALGREAFVDSKAFTEYTLPLVSLLRGHRLDRVTRKIFGETLVEDLWIPQFSVSCNLTASEAVVHRRGPLWKAVRASGSLPGVLAPIVENGDLLVDGGVLDNLPGDVMRSISGGPVIVVDVTPGQDLKATCESAPSPWRILRDRFLSRPGPGMPGIVDILMRATTLNSVRVAGEVKRDADLYLHPPVEGFGMLEFDAVERIVAIGYEYTIARIEEAGGPAELLARLDAQAPAGGA
jgi:predicted acylesterase/phospholipase RssA